MFRKHLVHSMCSVSVPLPLTWVHATPQGCSAGYHSRCRKGQKTGLKELLMGGKKRKEYSHPKTGQAKVQQDFQNLKKTGCSEVFRQMLLSITMKKTQLGHQKTF